MIPPRPTPRTTIYSEDELRAALATGISSQALWLLISIEHYGWRAEFDMISRLLCPADGQPTHAHDHARLQAYGCLFLAVDRLWRLVAGVQAFREGREFLNKTDGYLSHGGNLMKSLDRLVGVTEVEWAEIVAVPDSARILSVLTARSASSDRVVEMTSFAEGLPAQLHRFARELRETTFAKTATTSSARPASVDMRELDNNIRHGAAIVYHDCSPTEAGWNPAAEDRVDLDDTVGIITDPPAAVGGPAYIPLFKTDEVMDMGLIRDAAKFGEVIRRIAIGVLADLGLGDPLAVLRDIPDLRSG